MNEERRFENFETNGSREIFTFEKKAPDDEWILFHGGQEWTTLPSGQRKDLPNRELFPSREAALAWLNDS